MAIRIKDVAAAVGVSDATVSLALSGNPRISAATRDRVLRAADALGYRPNSAARALRTDTTRTLGLIVSDVANPFFAELAGEIERQAEAQGYSVLLCNSDEDPGRQDNYLLNMLAGRQADAVIVVPTAAMTPGLRAAGAQRAKLVLLDRPITVAGSSAAAKHLRQLPAVRADIAGAVAEAAEMLHQLGHRRVGIVAAPQDTPLGRQRRAELRKALVVAGIAPRDVLVEEGDFRADSGFTAGQALLSARRPPSAIVACDGLMGVGVLKAARAAGLRVPHDVSLLCFDDAPWFELFDPPLTAIAQPVAELARMAVDAAVSLIDDRGASAPPKPPCTLIRRSSCGVPRVGS